MLMNYCASLKREIITKMLSIAKQLPDLTILESIPGIGETTAVLLLAELGDVRRFNNANKINAFVGIDLRHYESGNSVAADHISKRGNSYARKLLYRTIGNIASAARNHHTSMIIIKNERSNPLYQLRRLLSHVSIN